MNAFYPTLLDPLAKPKRSVFVSYYHADDQAYRNILETWFGHLFISKSVDPSNIMSDLSTEYIKHLIQDGYISDCTVLIVLISQHTRGRKHVDWEISAALNYKVGDGYAGLVGILLPTFQLLTNGRYQYDDIPDRLADNVKSGYATIYNWNVACASAETFLNIIESSYNSRSLLSDKIDNSRLQMQRNTAPAQSTLLSGL
jgi:MTH538 TIR-like domain (DUF1863)